ncbi:hypothetical protein E3N88_33794 [Mikania micrantha]|uniref:Uncharacterized protein n=1 Tax=Mikania micrantha TaxID=192012 RepID=A0A5N6MD11_9ASTR|nr:hypothetical protein E3N88_33794 [Mikania micrantha]
MTNHVIDDKFKLGITIDGRSSTESFVKMFGCFHPTVTNKNNMVIALTDWTACKGFLPVTFDNPQGEVVECCTLDDDSPVAESINTTKINAPQTPNMVPYGMLRRQKEVTTKGQNYKDIKEPRHIKGKDKEIQEDEPVNFVFLFDT